MSATTHVTEPVKRLRSYRLLPLLRMPALEAVDSYFTTRSNVEKAYGRDAIAVPVPVPALEIAFADGSSEWFILATPAPVAVDETPVQIERRAARERALAKLAPEDLEALGLAPPLAVPEPDRAASR